MRVEIDKKVVGKNLTKLVKNSGKSRKEICAATGIGYSTFTEWINGRKYPRPEGIELLANYFGVSKADLIEEQSVLPAQLSPAEIGSRIQERLTQKGITPAEMDDLTGFKKGTTAKWIAGKITNPPIGMLEVLSAATGLSISLLRGDPTEDPLAKYQNLLDALNDDLPDIALTNQEVQQIITYIKFLISQRR